MIAAIKAVLRARFPRQAAFITNRFSNEGTFGLQFTIGVLIFLGAGWVFGGISEDLLTGDPLIDLDQVISDWFRTHASPRLTEYMLLATSLASIPAVIGLTTLASAFFLWTRQPYWLLSCLLVMPGGMLLNIFIKNMFIRARPGWADPLMALTGYSFPSGHTMMATLAYGFLGAFLVRATDSWPLRGFITALTVVIILSVALSRMYLGAHYLSDVLAAMAAGTWWLVLCITSVEVFRRHRLNRRVAK